MMNAAPLAMELMKARPKERSDMILEPLHVMITMAMLGFCPEGTKLTIVSNLLHLQKPTWTQGIRRWYQQDTKEDLYYLFHAIRRYYKWYKKQDNEIFNYILQLSKNGIKKLIITYSSIEKKSILHTLSLYKNILNLDIPDLFNDADENTLTIDNVFESITTIYDQKLLMIIFSLFKLMEATDNSQEDIDSYLRGMRHTMAPINRKIQQWITERLTF